MSRQLVFAIACLLIGGLSAAVAGADESFQAAAVGTLPDGWTTAQTGAGAGSVWRIQEDKAAPDGSHVLVQTSSSRPRALFNLCVASQPQLLDLDLTVSVKALVLCHIKDRG